MKTEEKNKEVVREFFKAMEEGNLGKVRELLASDFKFYNPAAPKPISADDLIQ